MIEFHKDQFMALILSETLPGSQPLRAVAALCQQPQLLREAASVHPSGLGAALSSGQAEDTVDAKPGGTATASCKASPRTLEAVSWPFRDHTCKTPAIFLMTNLRYAKGYEK